MFLIYLVFRSVADLELISRILFGGASTNNDIPPLPFREVTLPKKMKFGYYTSGKRNETMVDLYFETL